MSKKLAIPASRKHILINDMDWEWLERAYGIGSESPIGVSEAIRRIVHARVGTLKAQQQALMDARRQQPSRDAGLEPVA